MPANSKKPNTFAALGLPKDLLSVLAELGFEAPTPIQAAAIPLLLKGRDVIGQAHTGSGKTAAFGLPILSKIQVKGRRLQSLVLCPTRELAAQVARELRKLGRRHPGLQVLVVAGGQPARPQLFALEKGAHIVVGTPGRVADFLRRDKFPTHSLTTVVLDEADRMLDMGFQEDMELILEAAPKSRQTLFFSATFPDSIEEMSAAFQKHPERLEVSGESHQAPAIEQHLYEFQTAEKRGALLRLLQEMNPESAIVFANFKASAAETAKALNEAGITAGALHGDLEQRDRDLMMAKFRNKSLRVLVATDVAARGLDVEALDLVVNFDLPVKPEIYVHRIGRSGRAGRAGIAVSFATPREGHKIEEIEALTGLSMQRKKWSPEIKEVKAAEPSPTSGDEKREPSPSQSAAMTTLAIMGGRKDKLRPADILGALTGEAGGLPGSAVGKIEIHDRIAYVAIAKNVAKLALERLQQGRIKGRKFVVKFI